MGGKITGYSIYDEVNLLNAHIFWLPRSLLQVTAAFTALLHCYKNKPVVPVAEKQLNHTTN
ncbi:hypothetical protein DXN05_20685 [Deminuibacter soli]|uniref:Uncharacterized protein n=1 Tax=Deminuibacter soli TaxID=2291815 RepID=A0A3E1NEX2_9BACT|nr:hypothetical protein DXN05_20685 [Deminuibacter soli]